MTSSQRPRSVDAQFTTDIFARIGLDRYTVASCAIGSLCVGWTARGVSAVRRADSPEAEAAFTRWYAERTGRRIVRAIEPDAIARAAQAKLRDPAAPDVPLDLAGASDFERAVFERVARVRRGYARPIELLAREVPLPPSAPRLDAILAANPVPLLVPCHRVIREDRCCAGDYVFGARAQAQLLESEGLDPAAVDRLTQRGVRYIANDGWFCLPTCGDIARRAGQPGYVELHSLAEAQARGLHACEECRPLAAA